MDSREAVARTRVLVLMAGRWVGCGVARWEARRAWVLGFLAGCGMAAIWDSGRAWVLGLLAGWGMARWEAGRS